MPGDSVVPTLDSKKARLLGQPSLFASAKSNPHLAHRFNSYEEVHLGLGEPGGNRSGNPDRGILHMGELISISKKRKFSLGIDRAAPQGRVL